MKEEKKNYSGGESYSKQTRFLGWVEILQLLGEM